MPQPRQPSPPPSASATYTSLFRTALAFISSQSQSQSQSTTTNPSRMKFPSIRALCTHDFQHSWGHNYAVSRAPPLQGTYSYDEFEAHLRGMLPRLESWRAEVTDVVVDEVRGRVVLRVSYWMGVKGGSGGDGDGDGEVETVENDLVWVLDLEREGDGEGEGFKVKRSIEFVDGIAAGRIREVMMGRKG